VPFTEKHIAMPLRAYSQPIYKKLAHLKIKINHKRLPTGFFNNPSFVPAFNHPKTQKAKDTDTSLPSSLQ
jgi:hypothetical protein